MPEVYVHAVKGRTQEQKKALVKDITDAVVKNFNAPAEAVVVTTGGHATAHLLDDLSPEDLASWIDLSNFVVTTFNSTAGSSS